MALSVLVSADVRLADEWETSLAKLSGAIGRRPPQDFYDMRAWGPATYVVRDTAAAV